MGSNGIVVKASGFAGDVQLPFLRRGLLGRADLIDGGGMGWVGGGELGLSMGIDWALISLITGSQWRWFTKLSQLELIYLDHYGSFYLMLRQSHFWMLAKLIFEDGQFRKSRLHGSEV